MAGLGVAVSSCPDLSVLCLNVSGCDALTNIVSELQLGLCGNVCLRRVILYMRDLQLSELNIEPLGRACFEGLNSKVEHLRLNFGRSQG